MLYFCLNFLISSEAGGPCYEDPGALGRAAGADMEQREGQLRRGQGNVSSSKD